MKHFAPVPRGKMHRGGGRGGSKNFISKEFKRDILVLPLVRMHWVLWEAGGCWERKGKMYVYFRATGTKAAPGKGREMSPKWKNLSWVLRSLSSKDFSAALGQKAVCKPKGRKVPILGHCDLSYLTSPNFPKTLGWNKKEFRVLSCLDGFPRHPKIPDEGYEEWLEI